MKTIFKYQLSIEDIQFIKMPKGSDPFTAEFQGDQLCIWASVDTDAELEDREFKIFGTGQPLDLSGLFRFIDTVHHTSGVWHIFAKVPG
jgi:hypothetical protein